MTGLDDGVRVPSVGDLVAQVKTHLVAEDRGFGGRAALVRELLGAVYEHVRDYRPGGEGLDGHDSDERRSLGKLVDAAELHMAGELRQVIGESDL